MVLKECLVLGTACSVRCLRYKNALDTQDRFRYFRQVQYLYKRQGVEQANRALIRWALTLLANISVDFIPSAKHSSLFV